MDEKLGPLIWLENKPWDKQLLSQHPKGGKDSIKALQDSVMQKLYFCLFPKLSQQKYHLVELELLLHVP